MALLQAASWQPAEMLEQRIMMSAGNHLVGVNISERPNLAFDTSGTINYTAATGQLTVAATNIVIAFPDGTKNVVSGANNAFSIQANLDSNGNLTANSTSTDLQITGSIQDPGTGITYGPVLLTGKIAAFGYDDTGTTDTFDFEFVPTGGQLFTQIQPDLSAFYGGQDIGVVLTGSGTPGFTGSFSADFNEGSVQGNEGPVPVSILTAPTIDTVQEPATALVGSTVADSATVTGNNPTGTVTFNLYNNPAASGTPLFSDTEPLVGTTATSAGYTATATGTDYWVATYNGDSNNTPVTSSPTSEPVTISSASPSIITVAGGSLVLGSGAKLTDSATLSGGYNPSGTITFDLFAPGVSPNATDSNNVYSDTVTAAGNGTYTTATGTNPGGYLPTTTGTYEWVAVYSGDSNNSGATSPFGSEPETVSGTPNLMVTKTADATTVTAGSTVGYTVTISNASSATASALGITLTDPLPGGAGNNITWAIDNSEGNPSEFTVTGPVGSQNLVLSSGFIAGGDSLAPGQSISVHVTGMTSAADATGGPAPSYLGAAGNYDVLYTGTGGHNLSITNVTINGNVGVGGTGQVQFSGPGKIGGRLDFAASNTGQYHNNNASNVGPTSVNYGVSAVTTALNTITALSSSLAGTGTNLAISGNQTINESAGQLVTINGVSYRVFNVTSYSENDGKLVTIVGDGSGDPVVFDFGFNSNVNLGGDVSLNGGLTDDGVIWNFATSGKNIQLNNNRSSYPQPLAFHGILLAPNDAISVVNASLDGRIFGGGSADMQIVSGDYINTPSTGMLFNSVTVSATGDSGQQDESSSATITIIFGT